LNENSQDDNHYNDEFRRRIVENNFDLMNGLTIQVVTNKETIPKHFLPLDNMDEMKAAVASDLDQNNLGLLLQQTQKRKERDEITTMF